MEKFKMSIIGRPKYVFDPKTKHTSCIINYDLPDILNYLTEGPSSPIPGECPKTSNFISKDGRLLWDTMRGVYSLILGRLMNKGIIKVDGNDRPYVEGIAKFNPEDDIALFDKQKGRMIAMAKAKHELIRVKVAIVEEIHNLALHLEDCAQWMLTGKQALSSKLTIARDEIQRVVELPIGSNNKDVSNQ